MPRARSPALRHAARGRGVAARRRHGAELLSLSWVDDYFAAWARHAQAADPAHGAADRARLLAFMDAAVRYEDVPTGQVFTGHEGVVRMGALALRMAPDLRFTCVSAQESADRFAFETETHGTDSGSGKAFVLRGVSVGRRGPDGAVVEHKDYWDLASYLRQVGASAAPS